MPADHRLAADGGADHFDTRAPADAAPASGLFWFLHISDTHFGSGDDPRRLVSTLLREVVPVIHPAATINSGDLTDDGRVASAWSDYRAIIAPPDGGGAPPFPAYLEVPGNHDVMGGGGPNYLSGSQSGRAGGGYYGVTNLDAPAGRVRIIRANTADSSGPEIHFLGVFGEQQRDHLLADPGGTLPAALSLVVGHHPLATVTGGDRLRAVIDHYAAGIYLCGHLHIADLSWVDHILVVRVPSFGKGGSSSSLALVAADATGPAAKLVDLDSAAAPGIAWPVVLITTPANATLGSGNPLAARLPAGAQLPLRLLAFSPGGVTAAEYRVDQGAWKPLGSTGGDVWQATLVVPARSGRHTIEARAQSGLGTGIDTISVSVE